MRRLLVLLTILLMAAPAMAGEGLYLGTGLMLDHYSALGPLYMVPAINVKLGYNFGLFALEGNLMEDTHDDKLYAYGGNSRGFRGTSRLDGKAVDVRIPFTPSDQKKSIYGLIGIGEYSLSGNDPTIPAWVKYSGVGYNLGVGIERSVSQHITFNLAAIYRTIRFDKKETLGITSTSSPQLNDDLFSLEIGLNYYFF